jgi:hypothetical protein
MYGQDKKISVEVEIFVHTDPVAEAKIQFLNSETEIDNVQSDICVEHIAVFRQLISEGVELQCVDSSVAALTEQGFVVNAVIGESDIDIADAGDSNMTIIG